MKRDEPKTQTAINGPLGLAYNPSEKVNANANCLENHFTSHDLCDENHECQIEDRDEALH